MLRAADLSLGGHDLVCLAVPARALPACSPPTAGGSPRASGVLVVSKGLVPPLGTLPSAFAAERCSARAVAVLGGPAHAAEVLEQRGLGRAGSLDRGFSRQLADVLAAAKLDVTVTTDVTGVELAGCAKNAAVLAAAAAVAGRAPTSPAPPPARCSPRSTRWPAPRGGRPETFAGLAGAGDLVATVVASGSRNRRAGELLAQGMPAAEIGHALGQARRGGRLGAAAGHRRARRAPRRRPRSTAWPRWSRGGSSLSAGPPTVTEPTRPKRRARVRARAA